MQFNQKLIKQLAEGKIALYARPDDEYLNYILKAIGMPITIDLKHKYYYRNAFGRIVNNFEPQGLRTIPISDFILPEPKYKIGDSVTILSDKDICKIIGIEYDEFNGFYYYNLKNEEYSDFTVFENLLHPVKTTTLCGTQQQFIIGQQYEFSVCNDWIKGTLLGIVDNQYKYIALVGTNKVPLAFDFIRPIQPRKITRWINVRPDGRVLRKSYETEQEARNKACQGGMTDCKQVELKGVIAP